MPINPSPAVLRAGQILKHMARRPTVQYSVSELARTVNMPRATCDSVLQALAEAGLVVRREPELRYELGTFCIALGDAARAADSVLNAAEREAERLARSLSACVVVTARMGDEARVVAVSDWGPALALRAHTGQSIPLVPPFGAVFVAWDDDEAQAWLSRAEAVEDWRSDQWRQALAAIRRRGCSISVSADRQPELVTVLNALAASPESEEYRRRRDEVIGTMQHSEYLAGDIVDTASLRLTHISAPVFDATGHVSASLMLLGPQYDLSGAELDALSKHVIEAAARATKAVGGSMAE